MAKKYLDYSGLARYHAKIKELLGGKSNTNHTHNYAGSSSTGGAATTALNCTGNSATATRAAAADSAGYADQSFYADYSGQADYASNADYAYYSGQAYIADLANRVNAVTGTVVSNSNQNDTTYVTLGFKPSFVMVFLNNTTLNCLHPSDLSVCGYPTHYLYLPRLVYSPVENYAPNYTGITNSGFQILFLGASIWGGLTYDYVAFR